MEAATSYLTVLPVNHSERERFFDKVKEEILNDRVDKRVMQAHLCSLQDLLDMIMEDTEIFEKLNN